MHLVFTSNLYLPCLGGSVQVLERFARQFHKLGHDVTILTKTEGPDSYDGCEALRSYAENRTSPFFAVRRNPSFKDSVAIIRSADGVIMIEMSLSWLVRILTAGKRPVVSHHTHFSGPGKAVGLIRHAQRFVGIPLNSFACSRMIARQWGKRVKVLPNPYDPEIFYNTHSPRDVDFLFAARFGEDKGPLLFLAALADLKSRGLEFTFAMAGSGTLASRIPDEINKNGLTPHLKFLGECDPASMAQLYNRSRTTVIPSIWLEPFGLVAIEALACGCDLICSDQPGLREASGGMARYFPTNNLAGLIETMMNNTWDLPASPEFESHLEKYTTEEAGNFLLAEFR